MQVVAQVSIRMTADGNVVAQCQVPNRVVLLGMLEQAKIDLEKKLSEQARGGIEIAQAGVVLPR